MKKPLWIVVGLGVLIGGGIGVWQVAQARGGQRGPRYDTVAVDRGPIVAKVTATGTLSALVTVQVGSQVSGRIQEINVDFNSPVKKGQVIAQHRSGAVRGRARAGARQHLAGAGRPSRSSRRRPRTPSCSTSAPRSCSSEKLIAQAELDTRAGATRRAANGDVAAASGNARTGAGVAAPGAGEPRLHDDRLADQRRRDLAQRRRRPDRGGVAAGADAVPIAEDLRKMQVDTSVAEADVGRLQPGMDGDVHRRRVPGRDSSRGRSARSATRRRRCRTSSPTTRSSTSSNPELELRPGMTANVTFVYAERDGVLRVAERGAALPAAAGAGRARPGGEPARGGARGGEAAAARRRPRAAAATGAAAGTTRRPRAARRPTDGRVWVLRGPTPTRGAACASASRDGSQTEVDEGELPRAISVVTDADRQAERRRRPRPSPAGAGAFRRMF